jgi:hypothetical protein
MVVSLYRPSADDRLQILSQLLKTAFRLHCTGETLGDRGPWQLVREVQERLTELSGSPGVVMSEEHQLDFLRQAPTESDSIGRRAA